MATEGSQLLLDAAAGFLGLMFAWSGTMSLRDRVQFESTVAAYQLLRGRLARWAARVLSFIQIVAGISLFVHWQTGTVAPVAAGLFLLFAVAMAINLLRGRSHIDCGCHLSPRKQPLRWRLVFRNLLLAGAALAAAALDSDSRSLTSWFTSLPAAVSLFGIHLGWGHVRALDASRTRVLSRLPA